jgi:hypothetical protein
MLYPLEHLPITVDDDGIPQTITASDRCAIQCAHLWLRTYSVAEPHPPPSPLPSYTELWYMLKYFQQIQILVNSLSSNYDFIIDAHAARYAELLGTYIMPTPALSYREVREWGVTVPLAVVARCARATPRQEP